MRLSPPFGSDPWPNYLKSNALMRTVAMSGFRKKIPYLLGAIDGSVVFAYAVGIDPAVWHFITLTLKLAIAVVVLRNINNVQLPVYYFLSSILFLCLCSAPMSFSFSDYLPVVGFMAHLFISVLLVGRDIKKYCTSLAVLITVMAGWHIYLCLGNKLNNVYGRYFYLGNSHPNLGGEMAAIAAFVAALSLPRRVALPLMAILLADTLYLGSRAAMIVVAVAMMAMIMFSTQRKMPFKRLIGIFFIVATGLLLLIATGTISHVWEPISNALEIDSRYRGIGSGGSGRVEIWEFSWRMFLERPIVGHGFGYFERIGFVGSHNIVLFALAQNGIVGMVPLLFIMERMWRFATYSWFHAVLISAMLMLFMFNDRFININPYPFVLYLIVLTWRSPPQLSRGMTSAPLGLATRRAAAWHGVDHAARRNQIQTYGRWPQRHLG